MSTRVRVAACLALATLLSACGRAGAPAAHEAPSASTPPAVRVVATFYPYGELAREVAGPRAEVSVLVPDGAEPHDWEPRPSDALRLRDADLVVYNGAGFEPWLPRMLAGLPPDRPLRLEAAASLPLLPAPRPAAEVAEEHDHAHDHGHGAEVVDPHIWLDPVLLQDVVARLAEALATVDPSGRAEFARRAEALRAELAAVDREYRQALAGCRQRALLVSHGFFTYPAARYGLEQLAISGVAPEAEPSPRAMARLAELARQRGLRTLFAEAQVGRRVAEALAAEAGLEVRTLHPMEGLTPADRAQGIRLLDLFRRNLAELRAGLQCP